MAYEIGDPNHIQVHNALVDEVQTAASRAGVEVILPDVAGLGDLGHTSDHNLIVAALQAIADAGGNIKWATVTATTGNPIKGTYTDSAGDWTYYKWPGAGSVTVTEGMADLIVAGGGGAAYAATATSGAPGYIITGINAIPAGTHSITIGGSGGSYEGGFPTTFGPFTAMGGPGRVMVGNHWNEFVSSITGTPVTYGGASTGNGTPANTGAGGASPSGSWTGCTGVVILRVPSVNALA